MLTAIILLIIGLGIIDFFMIQKAIKINRLMENERSIFVEYLEKVNDYKMLKNIGEINMFDQRERWYPSPKRIIETLKEKMNDNNYSDYYEKYSKNLRSFSFFGFFSGFILFVIINLVSWLLANKN